MLLPPIEQFKSGYREYKPLEHAWVPVASKSPERISPEETLLEALRDRMSGRVRGLLGAVHLERRRIGGEGRIYIHIPSANFAQISRDVFAEALGIPKESMQRFRVNSDDPIQYANDAIIALPEKELRAALGIPALGAAR